MMRSPSGRTRHLPLGLLGMLVLVAATELLLKHQEEDFLTAQVWDWRFNTLAARRNAPGHEVLCLGDSEGKLGFQPRVFDDQAGLWAYNLCASGGQASSAYFLLRRALDAGARPAAIVLNLQLELLTKGPDYNERNWPELLNLLDCLRLVRTAGDTHLFTTTLLRIGLPSYRARNDLRFHVKCAFLGEDNPWRLTALALRRNWRLNGGGQVFRQVMTQDVNENIARLVPRRKWACHPANSCFLDRLMHLAAQHHVAVFWVLMPESPGMQRSLELRGMDAPYTLFAQRCVARFPNLTVIDGRRSAYPKHVFADMVHLNGTGAQALSRSLATIVAQAIENGPPPGRWLDLPSYQPVANPLDLEDFEQSKLVVAQTTRQRQ